MNEILESFQKKILSNSLSQADFADTAWYSVFSNPSMAPLLQAVAGYRNPIYERGEDKFIFHIPLGEEWEVRLDFIYEDNAYKLACMDGYTIPLKCVDRLPFREYASLPKREAMMREEYRISRLVQDYVRLNRILGKQEALNWFKDGAGERVGVPAWMPYFTRRKAFIAYTAWIQSRLYGEDVSITKFTEEQSELLFRDSVWLFLYRAASHIKQMISYDEYMELYEVIWQDRAFHNGLEVQITYEDNDVRMAFSAIPDASFNGSGKPS